MVTANSTLVRTPHSGSQNDIQDQIITEYEVGILLVFGAGRCDDYHRHGNNPALDSRYPKDQLEVSAEGR